MTWSQKGPLEFLWTVDKPQYGRISGQYSKIPRWRLWTQHGCHVRNSRCCLQIEADINRLNAPMSHNINIAETAPYMKLMSYM